ncbi:MAG: hypothetical protein AAF710_05310 [Planctomycetota bacterium]
MGLCPTQRVVWWAAAAAVAAAALLPGCQRAAVYDDYAAFVREPAPDPSGAGYRLGVPDTVELTLRDADGTRTLTQTLGPDGKLHVAGLAPVAAAGRTAAEAAAALEAAAAGADHPLEVSLRVQRYASQCVYVFGQVQRPGAQPYRGTNRLLDTLAYAEPTVRADTRRVQVLRPSPDGETRRRLTVDLDAIVQRGDSTLNVTLAAGDVVYLPPTPLGGAGLAWAKLFGPAEAADRETADHDPPEAPTPVRDHVTHVTVKPRLVIPPPKTPDTVTATLAPGSLDELHAGLAALTDELRQIREDATLSAVPNVPWQPAAAPAAATIPVTAVTTAPGGQGRDTDHREVRFWAP